MTREWVANWNNKIYWNEDGTKADGDIQSQDFWDTFGIKSWPTFKNACSYHVPGKWADDVEQFIKQVQLELEGRVSFDQIKEKWCRFTVYYSCIEKDDEDAETRMRELIQECIDRLISKGVHPPKQETENG